MAKKRTKRIVGARHLTSDEYVEMLKSEERKKKEVEDLKEQKKVERERKKIERENEKKNKLEKQAARRKEMENRKRKQLAERGKGREKKKCLETPSVLMESDSESSEVEQQRSYSEPDSADQESEDDDHSTQPEPSTESCRPRQHGILPASFRDDLSDDNDDGVICEICSLKEPLGMAGDTVFWVDCELCSVWVHTNCAFQKNVISQKCLCKECSS